DRQPEQLVDASCIAFAGNSRAKGSLVFSPIIRDDSPYRLRASALALACVVSRSKSECKLDASASSLPRPKAPPVRADCSASLSQRIPSDRQYVATSGDPANPARRAQSIP